MQTTKLNINFIHYVYSLFNSEFPRIKLPGLVEKYKQNER